MCRGEAFSSVWRKNSSQVILIIIIIINLYLTTICFKANTCLRDGVTTYLPKTNLSHCLFSFTTGYQVTSSESCEIRKDLG